MTLKQGLSSIISSLSDLAYNTVLLCPTSHLVRPPLQFIAFRNSALATSWRDILRNQWIVLSGLRSLRIVSKDGGPCNEYRIQKHSVEFRSVGTDGKPYTRESGMWRPLNGEEIQLHFALQTPVAEWLDKTLYSPAPSA
jgi:hypothetical protein